MTTHPLYPHLRLDPPGGGVETWKPVPGFTGYLVSDRGRVLSADRRDSRGRWRVGRILRQNDDGRGYQRIDLHRDGKRYPLRVHVGVLQAFRGSRPPGHHSRHLNGDPEDNRVENLAYGTASDNALDAVGHGTHPQTRKRECKRGHALDGDNLVPSALRRGWRKCRACNRARAYLNHHPGGDLQAVADDYYRRITGADLPLNGFDLGE